MNSLDLDTLECRRRARAKRLRRDDEVSLTVAEMAHGVIRVELLMRARGRSVLSPLGSPAWLAERRVRRVSVRGALTAEGCVESGLVWLATRGLVEMDEGTERYRWTANATDERLRRWLR